MEQLAVGASAYLIYNSRFQIDHNAARNVFSRASLGKERVEGVISPTDGLIRRHLAIRLNAVLQAEQLPARVANLDSALSNMNADRFTHGYEVSG
mmetsp:Transcript_56515/g.69074  ORF Transcript_56515/g.69074 Transcript_56515/m.69074 type:complete len:95 (+) Transcript_56515:550-834(+)